MARLQQDIIIFQGKYDGTRTQKPQTQEERKCVLLLRLLSGFKISDPTKINMTGRTILSFFLNSPNFYEVFNISRKVVRKKRAQKKEKIQNERRGPDSRLPRWLELLFYFRKGVGGTQGTNITSTRWERENPRYLPLIAQF